MKIGIKLWTEKDKPRIDKLAELADFIEVMAIEGNDYSFVREYGLPVVIHNPHLELGVNLANPDRIDKNISSLKYSKQVANLLEARGIIVHLGSKEHNGCAEKHALSALETFGHKSFFIENLTGIDANGIEEYGKSPDDMKRILSKTKCGFCLDLGHAAISAIHGKRGQIKEIREFLSLKPGHYHVCDVRVLEKTDHHHLGEGSLNLPVIVGMLPKGAWLTIETEGNIEKQKADIEFLTELEK